MSQYLKNIIAFGKKQTELFHKDNSAYIDCLVTCFSMRNNMRHLYSCLVIAKLITPIEFMEIEEKETLWESAKEYSKQRLNLKDTVDLCKSLCALEYSLS